MDRQEQARARAEIYEKYKAITAMDDDRIAHQVRANTLGQQITEARLELGQLRAKLEKGISIGSFVGVEYIPLDKKRREVGHAEHFNGTVVALIAISPVSPIEIVLSVETRSGRKETRSVWTQSIEYSHIWVIPSEEKHEQGA